ncbi:TetR/AcrR family transcriptional regulator [Jongsikchunia kroppenstedtii]|uniref:TetR/AcrR family transcriptional regulator n=1 Tax=Jongsikchunia kroppenstedtii TaxID=1121721 RepID=UPI00037A5C7C|nr:TetR/AcrR family transcriptional regulator [Jongsikchunia kroppenstedtii]
MTKAAAGRRKPVQTRTRLDADDRREQIVDAARRLFADRPYEQVSTADVAKAAGTTRTNVLYHFSSKRELFIAALSRFATVPNEIGYIRGTTAAERVESFFDNWLVVIERNKEAFIAMLRASTSSDAEVAGLLSDSMREWEDRLIDIVGMDIDDPVHRASIRCYQALITSATAAWLERGELDRTDVHRMLSSALVALAQSPTSGSRPG